MAKRKPMTITEFARMGGLAAAKNMTKAERSARAKHAVQCREAQRAERKALAKKKTRAA